MNYRNRITGMPSHSGYFQQNTAAMMSNILKYLTFQALFIFSFINLNGQHSFIIELNDTYATMVDDIIETTDGHYIFTAVRFDYSLMDYQTGKIYKVTPTGEIISQATLGAENEVIIPGGLHQHPQNENQWIVVGVILDQNGSGNHHLKIMVFSDEIGLIDQMYLPIPVYFVIFHSIIDDKNKLIVAGSYRPSNTNRLNLAIGRITLNGNLIDFNSFDYELSQFLSDLMENSHVVGTYGLVISGPVPDVNFSPAELFLTVDSLLSHTQTSHIPRIIGFGNTTGVLTAQGYVFAGKGYYNNDMVLLNPFQNVILEKFLPKRQSGHDIRKATVLSTDTDFIVIHETVFGDGQIIEYPAPNKSISLTEHNTIYTAGIKNIIPFEWPFQYEPSWIRVNKLDAELNIIWEKHYGGDAYYQVNSVTATSDGGVIVSGFKTYPGQAPLMNLLVIKLKPDGTVSLDELPSTYSSPGIVLRPNPATSETRLQLPENITLTAMQVELYSHTGRLLYRVQPTLHFHKIEVAHLPKGLYLVRVWDGEKWLVEKLVVR
jgi:hypothetical protein